MKLSPAKTYSDLRREVRLAIQRGKERAASAAAFVKRAFDKSAKTGKASVILKSIKSDKV